MPRLALAARSRSYPRMRGHGAAGGDCVRRRHGTKDTEPPIRAERCPRCPARSAARRRAIDRRQRPQLGDRHALIGLVHRLPDQPELRHRAVARDEPRIGGAAAGIQLRRPRRSPPAIAPQRARPPPAPGCGEEALAADRNDRDRSARRMPRQHRAQPGRQRGAGVAVVEPDVQPRRAPSPGSRWSRGCRHRCW